MDKTRIDWYIDGIAFAQIRPSILELGVDDYVALVLLLIGTIGYLTYGKFWAKPDPYLYKLFERPQEKLGTVAENYATKDIARQLSQENRDAVVFWGSQSGTAAGFAHRLARDCNQRFGLNVLVADLSDYDHDTIAEIAESKFVIFLLSTYGEGDPSDNTADFLEWIQKRSDKLSDIRYAALGLGNSNYLYYNKVVDDVVQCLEKLSATPLLPVGKADDADSGTEEDFASWRDDLFAMFQEKLGLEEHVAAYVPSVLVRKIGGPIEPSLQSGEPQPLKLSRKAARAYSMIQKLPIKNIKTLTGAGSAARAGRSCLHLEVDVRAHSQIKYKTGDHLAVWPSNPPNEVERLINVLGLSEMKGMDLLISAANDKDEIRIPKHTHIAALFRHYLEICAPVSRDTVSILSQLAPTASTKSFLQNLSTKAAYAAFISQHHLTLARLLEHTMLHDPQASWTELPLAFVIEALRPMTPRYYSISSSSMTSPRQMAIAVAVSPSELPLNPSVSIPGLTTSYLSGLDLSTTPMIYSHVRRSAFKMPFLHKTPIVLIAAGTGIAPFRGFLQERAQMSQTSNQVIGPVLLVFGCRSPDQDYLYRSEIEELQDGMLKGKLEILTAFSRVSGQKKCYVQDRLAEQDVKEKVVKLLCEQEGNLYFCGSTTMAKTAGRTIVNAVKQFLKADDDEAKSWMDGMKRSRRWQEDVWG